MSDNNNILNELQELNSSLAGKVVTNVYSVPEGYFESLAAQVLNRIKAMDIANASQELEALSPVLSKLSKEMSYTVPQGYFEGLEKSILSQIDNDTTIQSAHDELKEISPLLSGLKKDMPYSVPQGYFENITLPVIQKEEKAKVVSLQSRKWFTYAAAAVITGIILMAGFFYLNNNSDSTETGGKALAKFTKDVKKMDETQKDDLIDFIDAGLAGDESVQAPTANTKKEIKELLNGISDEELLDFTEQTEDIENVMITN